LVLTEHENRASLVAVTMNSAIVSNQKSRSKRIAGICAAAKRLGVTRGHLWAVLTNRRESVPLLARFRALKLVAPNYSVKKSNEKPPQTRQRKDSGG
jgi:hypothetical protein